MRRRLFSSSRALAGWVGAEKNARRRAAFGWAFLACVIASLAVQLYDIGWADIWARRPRSALFYLFVVLGYMTLPVADSFIYRRLWRVPLRSALAACMRKRIYNGALVGYSGEVFMLFWARSRVDRMDAQLAHEIKDINILSALVSTYVTAGLILYLFFNGAIGRDAGPAFDLLAIGTLLIAALAPVGFLFRRHFMVLNARMALGILGIHALRFLIVQAFILGQWSVEMPEIGVATLLSLLAVQLLVSRIPLIPNRELLFVSIGIAMSGLLELPQARIASLLITTTAMQQVLHLLVILVSSAKGARRLQAASAITGSLAE